MFGFKTRVKPTAQNSQEGGDDSKTLKALYSWVMTLLGLSLFLVVQVSTILDGYPKVHKFLEEFSFAVILAGLFSLTVEKYHREEFQKFVIAERDKLKKNVFLYAYGHNVSEQTRQEIRDLLECPFHREKVRLEWQFSPIAGIPDKVRLVKRFSYVQKNGTMQPKAYEYRVHINSAESPPQTGEIVSVKIRRQGKPGIDLPGPKGELATNGIEPLAPGEELEVCVTVSESRFTTGDDSYSSRHPVIGTTLVTVYVEAGVDLKVVSYCKSKSLKERADHTPPRLYAWQLEEGTLPFQGVQISWSPDLEGKADQTEAGQSSQVPNANGLEKPMQPTPPPVAPTQTPSKQAGKELENPDPTELGSRPT